jgi:pimeloyl-ACP methyl ester carboxylesterase
VTGLHIAVLGSGPRLVLVHGSVGSGASTWAAQLPLAADHTLVIPDRPGSPPNPPVDHVDFEEHGALVAGLVRPGDHLVGHSYGGVVALFAAGARSAELASLTVIEPPSFGVARGDPAADAFVAKLAPLFEPGRPEDPADFLELFSTHVLGRPNVPRPLSPEIEQGVRTLMVERPPWEAEPPLDELRRAGLPALVVSGGWNPAFEAVCDALRDGLGAQRAVVPGARHAAQRAPGFNELLRAFISGRRA